jgi:hypothetical protein
MPGVIVTTGIRVGPSQVNVAPASTWFVAGTSERGPITSAKLVTSLADFETYYGDYTASGTLHQQVQTFFEEGGSRAYVSRAVGASATAGSLTLNGPGPAPALTVAAASPGDWSSRISINIVNGVSAGFNFKLFLDGSLKYQTGDVANAAAAADLINASPIASNLIAATVITGAADLLDLAATALTAGVNGAAPTTAELLGALSDFGTELGAGAVSIPGQFGTTAWNGIVAHAIANNRIAILGFNPADTYTQAITSASAYYDVVGAEYVEFMFPHVKVPGVGATTLTISPEGYTAAKRSLAHNQIGPWQPGAGVLSQADYVTGIAQTVDKTIGDALDVGRVNAIRIIQGTVRIYGARSVSSDELNWRYITYRDTLNYIVVEAESRLEDLVFSTIDGRRTVFGRAEARLIGLLDPLRTAGGLYEAFDADGNQLDPGYSVEVSDALNPVAQLQNGTIKAKAGIRVSSVGDRIEVEIVKSNLASSVV